MRRKAVILLLITFSCSIICIGIFCAANLAGAFWSGFDSGDGSGNELTSGYAVVDALEWKFGNHEAMGPLKGSAPSFNDDLISLFEETDELRDETDEKSDEDAPPLKWLEIKIAAGDTLSKLAEKHGISVAGLVRANGLKNQHVLKEGQILFVPVSEKYVDELADHLKSKKDEEINKKKNAQPVKLTKYIVRDGDTLWSIANAFNLDINTLFGCNKLPDSNVLKVGTMVVIPNQDGILVKIKGGQTIEKIAKQYGIYSEAIISANKMVGAADLQEGQDLFLPGAKVAAAAEAVSPKGTSSKTNAASASTGFRWPVVGKISSKYGWRKDPIAGGRDQHTGLDIRAPRGRSIVASQSGKVVHSGWMGGYGKTIVIQHSGGYTTLYAHCSSLLVKVGKTVTKGQQIALVGSTGRSTGNHLHFEIRKNGSTQNPLKFLK